MFEKAIEVNSDAVELDVRRTKDNVIIVRHDGDYKGVNICDYNYDELERRFEDFKNSDDENAKIYGFADFAVDLMLQTGGKDIRRKKTQEEKEYEKELKSLGIDKDEFENWLGLFEDKAYPDFKGDADKDNDAYMKYLYDLYLNHADKYMDPEDLD